MDYDPSEEVIPSLAISILSFCHILPHADADTASTKRSDWDLYLLHTNDCQEWLQIDPKGLYLLSNLSTHQEPAPSFSTS